MFAIDTNILIRFLTHDDEKQFKIARALMEKENVFVPDSVLLETEWVLRDVYDYSTEQVLDAFRSVLGLKNVMLDDPIKMAKVLEWHQSGLDFAGALHLAKSEHLQDFKTFDQDFIKRAKGLTESKVSSP